MQYVLSPSHIMLTDPELALSSDDLPAGVTLHAAGWGLTFGSVAELVEHRTAMEAELDTSIQDWQRALEPPFYATTNANGLLIAGYVPTVAEAVLAERRAGAGFAEAIAYRARLTNGLARNWLWGRWYSAIEPAGELGCWHRSGLTAVISEERFRTIVHGWQR